MGVVVGWSCAVTIGYRYERLAYLCPQKDRYAASLNTDVLSCCRHLTRLLSIRDGLLHMCLNEHHLLLLLEGGFVGLSHSLLGVIQNLNYVSFGTVQVCAEAPRYQAVVVFSSGRFRVNPSEC